MRGAVLLPGDRQGAWPWGQRGGGAMLLEAVLL